MEDAALLGSEHREALRSRPAGGGSKPPSGALAEDCGAERSGKSPGEPGQVGIGKMSERVRAYCRLKRRN